jgi:hypothetical protein
LFQVIADRAKKAAVIVTTNQGRQSKPDEPRGSRPVATFYFTPGLVDNLVNGSIEICRDPLNSDALYALLKIWAVRSYWHHYSLFRVKGLG